MTIKAAPHNTSKLAPGGTPKPRDGTAAASYAPSGDTAALKSAPQAAEPELTEVVAKAKAAAETAPADAAEEASLAIPGVPTGTELPVTVKAQITVKGTAKVLEMSEDVCSIHLHVKGHALFIPVERDVNVSLRRQEDGSYLYQYKDNRSGETSEGVAKNIVVEGNTRTLDVRDIHDEEDVPIKITDLGGGHFKINGDGFEADINKT